jgi:methionine--tRNA ligase beta chain
VARWYDHLQHLLNVNNKKVFGFKPVPIPVSILTSSDAPFSANSPKIAAPSMLVEKKTEQPIEQVEQKAESVSTVPTTVKAAKPAKTDKAAKAHEAKANDSADLDPSKLDIRVGLVVKCWNHADSEKLLCEEIDLGEGSNRNIASGIRLFYSAEHLQGRKVLVLANLKERPIAGFKSQLRIVAFAFALAFL